MAAHFDVSERVVVRHTALCSPRLRRGARRLTFALLVSRTSRSASSSLGSGSDLSSSHPSQRVRTPRLDSSQRSRRALLTLSPPSVYGRRIVYIVSMGLFAIFTIPECVTDSFAVLVVFRFIAGCMASGVMCNAAFVLAVDGLFRSSSACADILSRSCSGSIGDVWSVNERGNKMATFSAVLFA